MQRTEQARDTFVSKPVDPGFSLDAGQFSASPSSTAHALFAPLHYESGYAYPLIVWLHGQAADERHLMRVMPMVSMRNYLAIAPRGVLSVESQAGEAARYGWDQSEDCVEQAEQCVCDCIEVAKQKFSVNPKRVFLAGFDTGGTMALRLAMDRPERFAGVLSLGGRFAVRPGVFGNLVLARKLPIYLGVGRDSAVYPPEEVCEHLRLLHSSGMSITLRQYPCGQELSPQMLSDVDRWIIEQFSSARESQAAA